MAGLYPDPPGYRIAWHLDGTIGILLDTQAGSVAGLLTAADLKTMNDDTASTYTPPLSLQWVVLLFPRKMDLDADWLAMNARVAVAKQWSPNTTNGVDGTWTAYTGSNAIGPPVTASRTGHVGLSLPGVRAVRFQTPSDGSSPGRAVREWQLYGEPSAGEPDVDRLELWHPTLDQKVVPSHFEFGDVPQNSTRDVTFRVKNLSPTQTATGVIVDMGVPTDPTPSFDAAHLFTHAAVAPSWLAQINIGDLAPSAVSSLVTVRQTLQSTAALSLKWGLIQAVPTTMAVV